MQSELGKAFLAGALRPWVDRVNELQDTQDELIKCMAVYDDYPECTKSKGLLPHQVEAREFLERLKMSRVYQTELMRTEVTEVVLLPESFKLKQGMSISLDISNIMKYGPREVAVERMVKEFRTVLDRVVKDIDKIPEVPKEKTNG